jgi:hypothetical protein
LTVAFAAVFEKRWRPQPDPLEVSAGEAG